MKLKEFILSLSDFDMEAEVFVDVGDSYIEPHTISVGSISYIGDEETASQFSQLHYPNVVIIHVDNHDE